MTTTSGILQNPLDNYRSVSYHFAVIIADNTDVFSYLDESAGNSSILNGEDILQRYMRPNQGTGTEYATRYIQPKSVPGGNYVVLLNSMFDAHFNVETVTLSNIFIPSATAVKAGAAITSNTTEGKIVLYEPMSADLMEAILIACESMNSLDISQAVFGLKIFFVGHNDNASLGSASSPSFNIHPVPVLPFYISDMDINFTDKGTRYNIDITPAANGVGNKIKTADVKGVSFTGKKTIKQTIESLNAALKNLTSKDTDKQVVITYHVELDSAYDDSYLLDNVNVHQFNGVSNGDSINFAAEPGKTIPQIISDVMMRSSKIGRDIRGENSTSDPRISYRPKVYCKTDSSRDKYQITYYVVRQPMALSDSKKQPISNNSTDSSQPGITKIIDIAKKQNAYIEYNYLYTGANTDVLRFDVSIPFAIGAALVYRSNNTATPINQSQSAEKTAATETSFNPSGGKIPVRPAGQDRVGNNMLNPGVYKAIRKSLEMYTVYSVTEGSLTVRGNPVLLQGLINPTKDFYDKNNSPSTIIEKLKTNTGDNIMSGWTTIQPIVQLNLKIPRSKNLYISGSDSSDTSSRSGQQSSKNIFSQDFWHRGTFMLTGVTSTFDRGSFTQVLEIMLPPAVEDLPNMIDQKRTANTDLPNTIDQKRTANTVGGSDNIQPSTQPVSHALSKQGKATVANIDGKRVVVSTPGLENAKRADNFLDSVAASESAGKYDIVGGGGNMYLGRYQMGPSALADAGLMKKVTKGDPVPPNAVKYGGEYYTWKAPYTREAFLSTPAIQDDAIKKYHAAVWRQLPESVRQQALDGTRTLNGVKMTPSGLIAASHLVGAGNMRRLLRESPDGNVTFVDGNGVPATKYMEAMGNKPIDYIAQIANHPSKGVLPGGVGTFDVKTISKVKKA